MKTQTNIRMKMKKRFNYKINFRQRLIESESAMKRAHSWLSPRQAIVIYLYSAT
jgi:hypothetical protein